ncbi:ArsR/SmtB family transcription factor [Salinibacter ruber]|uniref:ArsR/SmtB family transcription factor n=1 Tax=Salinibacter ruber TaxID=146919 RepID=UPI000E57CCFC|nr:metalloregulator ArsR/SmtB family transcription factor [Salinibacter ruber]
MTIFDTKQESTDLKAKLFRGFADPSRFSIIETLRDGPLTVGEIVEETGLSQPNTSNHLNCLADCGLVRRERDGRYVRYELSDERVAGLVVLAEGLLADIANGVYACTRYDSGRVDETDASQTKTQKETA